MNIYNFYLKFFLVKQDEVLQNTLERENMLVPGKLLSKRCKHALSLQLWRQYERSLQTKK